MGCICSKLLHTCLQCKKDLYKDSILAAPSLTPTTFMSGANDALAAVDVYTQKGLSVINNAKTTIGMSSGSLVEKVFDKPVSKQELSKMITVSKKGEIIVDKQSLLKGIISSNTELNSAVNGLKDTVKDNVLVANVTSKIKATVGGINSYICKADLSTVNSLVRAVSGLRGLKDLPFKFTDVASITTLGSNLVKESAKACLTGVFKQLSQEPTYKGEVMNKITGNITGTVLGTTNNNLLTEVVDAGYGSIMLRKQPDFINKYLKNYDSRTLSLKTKKRELSSSLVTDYNKINAAFNGLDPNWNSTPKPTGSTSGAVLYAAPINTASPIAKQTISAGLNAQAPSFGSAVKQAFENGDIVGLNTAATIPTPAFSLVAMYAPAPSIKSVISQELMA